MRSIRNAGRSLLRAAQKVWQGWMHQEGEPRFWEVFASAAAICAAFMAGYLTTPIRIVTAVILAIFAASAIWRYRVWLHRKKHKSLRGFERASIFGIIVVTTVLIAADITYNGLANSTQSNPSGHPVSTVQSPGISAAVSDQFYRIILPVDNLSSQDRQLKQIDLLMAFPAPACAEAPVALYRVANTITVNRPSGAAQSSVSANSSPASGFEVPSIGKLNFSCGVVDQLHLKFYPPGLSLQSQSTTRVVIDIPKNLHVDYQFLPSKQPLHTQVSLPSISGIGNDYMAFHITATVDSRSKLDSCFVLSSILPSADQGPQKCNSKVEGVSAFQPHGV